MYETDFYEVSGRFCDTNEALFFNINPYYHVNLNTRSPLFDEISIPSSLLKKRFLKTEGFNHFHINYEIEKNEKAFLAYNRRRIELAIDTFGNKMGDLFDLIPFLIHSKIILPQKNESIQNSPAGIDGYVLSPEILTLAKKYSIITSKKNNTVNIEGLYTIGSIGSIAQSAESDIDYWVCIDKAKLKFEEIQYLRKKTYRN